MRDHSPTLGQAYCELVSGLSALQHIANPQEKAAIALEIVAGAGREEVVLEPSRRLSDTVAARLDRVLEQARQGMPLAYALGECYFAGRRFLVNENVLIPRPDTETLLQVALRFCQRREGALRVLEIGVGSGAVIVSLGAELAGRELFLTGTDVSQEALEVAAANADSHQMDLNLLAGSLFAPLRQDSRFDLLVSNPPYVGAGEQVEDSVRAYEPANAYRVPAGNAPTHFHRRIAEEARERMTSGAMLALEVGFSQADEVSAVLRANGYVEITSTRDLAGVDRVVSAICPA
ncbi:MAG: protein-(glutamine-N5) methyltransferase, release factor-specific [Candidatus Riflebacteria bacterium RBG_13_59_9]|nr:MAG: protein-(glutamine-N5) methyltransferase, release factor-specific [Candidatus Riflebacteria bacterium RBG_13_59_9]